MCRALLSLSHHIPKTTLQAEENPILQMQKLRLRDVKFLLRDHKEVKRNSSPTVCL